MTTTNKQDQIAALRQRELDNLRIAFRAQRYAMDAIFFGDDHACRELLETAQDATDLALICALEAADLAANKTEGEHL